MTCVQPATGAVFSPCGRYRYRLWRSWDAARPVVTFVMLNPSTADEVDNDQTVARCQNRAHTMGYGGVRVANLFALCSKDPNSLYRDADPVGPDNDAAILALAKEAALVVCAWGGHGALNGRDEAVLALLRSAAIIPYCLARNTDGTPRHPLYVAYSKLPVPL